MSFKSLLPLALLSLALTACGPRVLTIRSFDGSKKAEVTVEIADTPAERDKGLMNRTVLEEGTGMLFVFKEPSMLAFWMKNTLIPLDILFFDQHGEFVSATQMVPCTKDPCTQYKAQSQAQFALEVNPDFRKSNEIGVGWRIDPKQVMKMARPK